MEKNQVNKSYIWAVDENFGWNYTTFFSFFNEFNREDDHLKYVEFGSVSVLCLCSLVINLTLIGFFLSHKELRRDLHLYTISIMLSSVLLIPFICLVGITRLSPQGWMFGKFACQTTLYMIAAVGFVKIWLMTLTSVDRYLRIVHPFSQHIGHTLSIILMLVAWIIPAASLAAVLYPHSETIHVPDLFDGITICTIQYQWSPTTYYALVYFSIVFLPEFVLPAIVMTICYALIMRKIKRSTNAILRHESDSHVRHPMAENRRLKANLRRRRTTIILISILTLFLAMWLPQFVLLAAISFDNVSRTYQLSSCWVVGGLCVLILNTIIEPLLYLLTATKVRKELLNRWRTFKASSPKVSHVTDSAS